jgi:hypothetical protein
MLTQGKIDQFYKDVNSLKLKYPVAEIQRATKFPKSNVSEWLSKKKVPSENFINAFYEKFKVLLHESSTNVHSNDIMADDSYGSIAAIEIKTASGKTIHVKPEGQTEITLLNAFLEERDRVIETLKEEKQARIDELSKDKEDLMGMLNSALGKIYASQQIALAYQKAWVDYEAEKVAKGDHNKKKELMYKMGKLVDGMIENDAAKGILAETDKLRKEGQ